MAEFDALELDESAHARRMFCSWEQAGWRSLLVRRFDDDPVVEQVEVPPSDDQQLVLVTSGRMAIESGADGRWRNARYAPGSIGLTAPNRLTRLRWRSTSPEPISRLHIYLPGSVLHRVADEVCPHEAPRADSLALTDPVLMQMMLALANAAAAGAPDLYAESAAEFLAVHILVHHTGRFLSPAPRHEDVRVRRVLDFMRDNLHQNLTLAEMAREAGLSTFHFLRVFKAATGRTPHRHLTELRVEIARHHLENGSLPVGEIAYLCGFSSPAHLSTVFTRTVGTSPSAYRRQWRA
ncbi:AraC family transcriptional regulator [Pseudonocardia alaniniphila]|uniref:AraC family transcriptional regulator n=1 Tax=Pseudonocardia alaniniphila TaxID=75291 RepID=A0ABS9TFL0_9PSEU|nr:AraC family transcriptional regulator [Pseudonocardia alaniniphila]MCH6167329.1 AraC family transcriptional regulator [Pseudonocardia alaniniphila]